MYHEAYCLPETPNSIEEFVEDVKEGRVKSFYIKVVFLISGDREAQAFSEHQRDDEEREQVRDRITQTNITSFTKYMDLPRRESASEDFDRVRPPPAHACRA
jgi:hypothetical protein